MKKGFSVQVDGQTIIFARMKKGKRHKKKEFRFVGFLQIKVLSLSRFIYSEASFYYSNYLKRLDYV